MGGNANLYNHFGEHNVDSLTKLKIEPPFDAAIPFLGHLSGENQNAKRYTHPSFHSSTIHNSQNTEAT